MSWRVQYIDNELTDNHDLIALQKCFGQGEVVPRAGVVDSEDTLAVSNDRGMFIGLEKTKNVDLSHGVLIEKTGAKEKDYLRSLRIDTYLAFCSTDEVMVRLKRIPFENVKVTGRIELDYLHAAKVEKDIDILYAPTWENESNGGVENINAILAELSILAGTGMNVQVAFHPRSHQGAGLATPSNLECSYGTDNKSLVETIARSKVLVTDYSSVCYYSMMTNTALMFYNSFKWHENDRKFYPEEIRFGAARKVGHQFTNSKLLVENATRLVFKDDPLKEDREALGEVLFGDVFDGRCVVRQAEALFELTGS